MSSSTSTGGRYVPPHLRNRQPPLNSSSTSSQQQSQAGPSRIPYTAPPGQSSYSSTPAGSRSQSRTPWSSSRDDQEDRRGYGRDMRSDPSPGPSRWKRDPSPPLQRQYQSNSAPSPSRRPISSSSSVSPTLHVFGDSFVGPFKLLSDDCARYQTFKGASAKGLNNPNSIKQVSKDLLPIINNLLAPPPYAYFPSTGRWILLIFGNVDLQINYLWQLQHKPITSATFAKGVPSEIKPNQNAESTGEVQSRVLASATETSLTGSALGPELFVQNVIKAYTTWLEREVINGPIGERIKQRQTDQQKGSRRKAPGKILISAALPPLVEDEILPRIPEKYVERLEEDHAKAQRRMGQAETADKPPQYAWSSRAKFETEDIQDGLSTLKVSDQSPSRPPTPLSAATSTSSQPSSHFDTNHLDSSVHTEITEPSSPSRSDKSSDPQTRSPTSTKTSIETLLKHDPPLCTLPTRIEMTNHYNTLLKEFCGRYPDILEFIDITPQVLAGNYTPSEIGAADRSTWACPVDPTNIHPVWEPTLPLWLEELKRAGVPTEGYRINADAEETFKAYEADKKMRVARRQREDAEAGPGVKLRDE